MDVTKYRIFLRAVELGNLTRCAEETGYTQSAISRIIADLEREWEVKLLARSRSGVTLTSAGEDLLPRIRAVCAAQGELEQQVAGLHGLTVGTIRVSTFNSFSVHCLPELMKSFLEQYPGVRFEVVTHIEYRQVEDWVAGGQVDCGFVALPTALELDTLFLRRDRQMAVLPQGHPMAAAESYPVTGFGEEPYIKLEDDRDREIVRIFEQNRVRPNLRYTVNDDYAVMAMVESGLGISVLSELVLKRNPYRIISKPLDPPEFRDIALAVRDKDSLSPVTARFVEHVRAWARAGD